MGRRREMRADASVWTRRASERASERIIFFFVATTCVKIKRDKYEKTRVVSECETHPAAVDFCPWDIPLAHQYIYACARAS